MMRQLCPGAMRGGKPSPRKDPQRYPYSRDSDECALQQLPIARVERCRAPRFVNQPHHVMSINP